MKVDWRDLEEGYFGWYLRDITQESKDYQRGILKEASERAESIIKIDLEDLVEKEAYFYALRPIHLILNKIYDIHSLEEISDKIVFDNESIQDSFGIEEFERTYNNLKKPLAEYISSGEEEPLLSILEKIGVEEPKKLIKRMKIKVGKEKREKWADMIEDLGSINSEILPAIYKQGWAYSLAEYWIKNGNPSFINIDPVHSKIGRLASNIYNYYRGATLIPVELPKLIEGLGIRLENPTYWNSRTGKKIVHPKFPIESYTLGMLVGSMVEGNAHIEKQVEQLNIEYYYGEKKKEIRKKALERLKKRIGEFKTELSEKIFEGKELEKFGGKLREYYKQFYTCLPVQLLYVVNSAGLQIEPGRKRKGLREDTKEKILNLADEEFSKGYVEQALWENGYSRGGGIGFQPYNLGLWEEMLKRAGIKEGEYSSHDINSKGGKEYRILKRTVEEYPWIGGFAEVYQSA